MISKIVLRCFWRSNTSNQTNTSRNTKHKSCPYTPSNKMMVPFRKCNSNNLKNWRYCFINISLHMIIELTWNRIAKKPNASWRKLKVNKSFFGNNFNKCCFWSWFWTSDILMIIWSCWAMFWKKITFGNWWLWLYHRISIRLWNLQQIVGTLTTSQERFREFIRLHWVIQTKIKLISTTKNRLLFSDMHLRWVLSWRIV